MRAKDDTAGIAERFDSAVIRNLIAELNDLRNTPEMFHKTSRSAKGLPGEVVNRNLSIIEMGIGDSLKVFKDQVLDNTEVLPDGGGADLFVVANDQDCFSQIQGHKSHNVTLARLIDNDDVEARTSRVEIFNNPRERHHPYRHGVAAFPHFFCRLGP